MIFEINPFGRKEWNSNSRANKIRTQLLLYISKETQNHLGAIRVMMNSKSPQKILAECEEYEIVINAPVIIGNKRDDSIGSNIQKNCSDKRNSSTLRASGTSGTSSTFNRQNQRKQTCPFTKYCSHDSLCHITQETRLPSTNGNNTIKQFDEHEATAGDKDHISYDRDLQELKNSLSCKEKKGKEYYNGMKVLYKIVTDRIIKPLPKIRVMRHAKKHETMEFDDKKIMKRIEQITFREETTFYNDTDDVHAIDLTVYEGINKLTMNTLKHFKRNDRQRSHTEQLISFPQRNLHLISLK